ncbi:hypothetical protein [Mycobacteroides franklinii]|uniref:Uncharacterized protein n=1 Tax=Mycobacteroides franklinii TaxID=948102 RepID=A0A4R8RBD6_9MYCO|nr:hypothetical protein [Mycobacteroides franklinii]TDZ41721.1 hypothetical protein CCUG64054_01753 [Mycobacteroides franklinii]TDZ51869.1 hypothetical protein CCUG63697_00339 [Mycobacteroides franklinii]TDZ55276.1 hypothetical protein CCUG63696_01756 [Mycobacteroides franklinii]TDZ62217.1 hypothetical protein CCUG63695_01680 [Mycobacteroides franklinii]TDZ68614.1 hypothetical protein CCUG64056_01753 [Mycobacteroides franklinii]
MEAGTSTVNSTEQLDQLTVAILALQPTPREKRWSSVSLCIIDAVWSIGVHYGVVEKIVAKMNNRFDIDPLLVDASAPITTDPFPLERLLEISEPELTNTQRTSTRSGILKADAVLRYAKVFIDHGIHTLPQAIDLLEQPKRLNDLDRALKEIPGEGDFGIRRGCLWMNIGDDQLIKPDRMVLHWIERHVDAITPNGARQLIGDLAS